MDSEWVDYEAEVATYVPAFIAPCVLEPPFSGYQTADLSNWKGEATDSNWLALVERIAEKIGREGVAAAARARASSDEHAQYDFAKRYPEEPVARKIWLVWETRHREVFNQRTVEAREKVRSRINAETVDLEARLAEARPAFEAWLADERRGAARELMPDPMAVIERRDGAEEAGLRREIALLSASLTKARTHEDELKAEVVELSDRLRAGSRDVQRLREELAALVAARKGDVGAEKKEIERLSKELEARRQERDQLRAQNDSATAEAKAQRQELHAVKEAASAESNKRRQELDAANALIASLSAQLDAAKGARGAASAGASSKPTDARPASASPSSKPSTAAQATAPAPEKGKSRPLSRRIWTAGWIIGLLVSLLLALVFVGEINSNYYWERQNANTVAIWLAGVLVASWFAYRRSKR